MIIQRAKIEEVHEIKKLLSETWLHTYGDIYSADTIKNITTEWHNPELLVKQILDPDIYFSIAREQNQIIGLITIRQMDKNILNMYRLYIHPDYQRKGIGSKLIIEALKVFKEHKKLRIGVEEENKRAISFYLSKGFKDIGRKIEKVGTDSISIIEMEKLIL